ncbi:MAG: DEAD/DEAH box helicase [Gammaproteobacteria bacterium]
MLFNELNLDEKLLRAVTACGFSQATDIQREAIPVVLTGGDLMASAQTGTGKTAAFVLPAMQRLMKPSGKRGKGPRVLVLTPTRELAMQVDENIRQLGRYCKYTAGNVVGGMPYPPQLRLLKKPLDLLVATPGRLMDHMEQDRVDFSRLEMLVLDEADRMLDMGFIDDVKKIARAMPKMRQTLLFSATLEGKVLSIANELLKKPKRIQLAANNERHKSIRQHAFHADDADHKHRLLSHHLSCDSLTQAVVFTATKRGADKLARKLSKLGHASAALHGDMRQAARKKTVERMRRGRYKLLVATDVAARGLDIKGISHVINFDLPTMAEDYIHRIGRTGRGGAKGTAISFIGPNDWKSLSGIERLTGTPLERSIIPGLEPTTNEPRSKSNKPKRKGAKGRGNSSKRYGRGRSSSSNDKSVSARRKKRAAPKHRAKSSGNRGQQRSQHRAQSSMSA